jgi:hypothetical protein
MALIPLNTFKTKTAVLTSSVYNAATCARDTGLIVDSIAFDLLYEGTSQSGFAGLAYWGQGAVKIPGESLQTLAAMDRAKEVAKLLVVNTAVSPTTGNTEAQVTNVGAPGNLETQTKIGSEFDLISSIIENGTAGTTSAIESNGPLTSVTSFLNAADLVYNNKAFLQAEVVAYINNKFGAFTYDKAKCARDTKLIVDSLAFDLLFNGDTQTNFAGLQYWSQGSTTVPSEQEQTLLAIARIKSVASDIIKNINITTSASNNLTQFVNVEAPGNTASQTTAQGLFDIISTILSNGTAGVTSLIVANGEVTSYEGYLNAYNLLKTNKRFIQQEIVSWITDQIAANVATPESPWYAFVYNAETCYRDVGYIIDCVCFDLIYGGNRQSVQAGVYYFGFDGTLTSIPNERSEAVTAFNHLKSLLDDIIVAKPLTVTYQTAVKQLINLPAGSASEIKYVQTQMGIITDSIENGPGNITNKEPISLTASQDPFVLNSFRLLLANKDFLAAEIVAFVDNLTAGSYSYNQSLCYRDVGYIIDCVTFDLRHGGNRQATQAGVDYYNKSSDISVVPTEKTDTINAYNYMKTVIENVLLSTKMPSPKQIEIKQLIDLPAATSTEVTSANSKVSLINAIINVGPSIFPTLVPINLVASSDLNVTRAFNLLLANKAFITAEIIGYLNTLTTPNTTKIYTAPPGVTAIILMAQASNVADENVSVTFAHYRNFGVFADPATLNGYQAADTITELVKEFIIPPNDSASLINGKMIVESFDSIVAYASKSGGIKVTLSILETANA